MKRKSKINLKNFWNEWADRKYMTSIVYPSIGSYLKNKKTKRVLDIGAEWFNSINKSLFSNNNIDYWIIDIIKIPKKIECNHFLKGSILRITEEHPNLKNFYNVVISFGVLGWYRFEKEEIKKYLENVYKILKPGGIFLLKLDLHIMNDWEGEFRITPKLISEYFTETSINKLPKRKLIFGNNSKFLFLTLKKI
jgi:SAM-dependent methyltransferase